MELMIKYSEFLTIIVQAFLITLAGFIFVGCWSEVLSDVRNNRSRRKLRKGAKRMLREYICYSCGFKAWALDSIIDTKCRKCGAKVVTKPVPKVEKSFIGGTNCHNKEFNFIEK